MLLNLDGDAAGEQVATNLVKRGATRDLAAVRIDVRVAGMSDAAAALDSLAALAAGATMGRPLTLTTHPNPEPNRAPTLTFTLALPLTTDPHPHPHPNQGATMGGSRDALVTAAAAAAAAAPPKDPDEYFAACRRLAAASSGEPTPTTAGKVYVERVLNSAPSWLGWAGRQAAAPYLAESGSWREFERCVGEMVILPLSKPTQPNPNLPQPNPNPKPQTQP